MPVSSYREQTLDSDTRQTLENSLAMQVIKLFAIIAKADKIISEQEIKFVSTFLDNLYPKNISHYLYTKFEEYIKSDLDYKGVAQTVNSKLSYQEKIFCLLKTYELILSDEAEEIEITTVHHLADLLNLKSSDIAFIEYSFGLRSAPQNKLSESTIIPLQVTGDTSTADVYMPFQGLDVVIYKIMNVYCIFQKDELNRVIVNDHALHKNIIRRIPHNTDVLINTYTLKYHDIKIYFENKIQPIQATLFISRDGAKFNFEHVQTSDSVLKLIFSGSLISLTPLNDEIEILINYTEDSDQVDENVKEDILVDGNLLNLKKLFKVSERVYVNLNDNITVEGNRLNLREIFLNLNSEIEITLDKSHDSYEITNDICGDIYFSDDHPEKWTAKIYREKDRYLFTPGNCPYQIFLNNKPLHGIKKISHGDTLYIKNYFLTFDFEHSTVKKTVFNFKKLVADNIGHMFDDGSLALDNVSFDINLGDLVGIMGPSGCGKSTLLSIISGLMRPLTGNVLLNENDLYHHYKVIKDYLGYVPQDDLLLPNLTVYENLYYYAKLRFPHKSKEEIAAQIELVLKDIGLSDKKNARAGQPTHKTLSGGERKRLNIGLELLADAEVYLLDEPTSGLSSKDSERIINLLANIANRGKIVLTVIHQPGSRLYKTFNKVILLDKGGRLVYQGSTYSALRYFKEHMGKYSSSDSFEVECPHCKTVQPGLLLDCMQESLRDIDGTTLRERKYSPEYWKKRYNQYTQKMSGISIKLPISGSLPPQRVITFTERLKQFCTLFSRNLKNKMRDRSNLLITFLEAPLLGVAIGFILRYIPEYNPDDEYTLYTNEVFRVFLFVSVIVTIFLSLTNSLDEIISDAPLFLRERMLNLLKRSYLAAKLIVLLPFAIVQNILFIVMGFLILEVRELYLSYVVYLSIVSLAGISIGLFVSSIPNLSSKAAQNVVPLILIPQIILGGALIQYEKMNRQLYVYKKSPIPEICHIMPSRWAYEGLMVLQETKNSYDSVRSRILQEIEDLKTDRDNIISQVGQDNYNARLERLETEKETHREKFAYKYGNQDIHDAIEYADYLYKENVSESDSTEVSHAGFMQNIQSKYPMFIRRKTIPVINKEVSTTIYNALVILLISSVINMVTLFMLRFREKIQLSMKKVCTKLSGCLAHEFKKNL